MKMKNLFTMLLLALGVLALTLTQLVAQEKVSIYDELTDFQAKMEEKCPDVAASFFSLQDSIMFKEGELSIKERQFIALGIAVSMGCEFCIYYHMAGAMESGATEKEIIEAASVALYMQGGPGLTYIKYVFDALEELSAMKESQDSEK